MNENFKFLKFQDLKLPKRPKKGVFSFLQIGFFFVIFFPGKVYSGLTNSLSIAFFFTIKKTAFLLTNSEFYEVHKIKEFISDEKKIGTFVRRRMRGLFNQLKL